MIPALIFSVGHAWPMWPQTFLTGLLLGYLCWYTGSLGYGILIHMLYNGSAFLGISAYSLLMWNRTAGMILSLLIVVTGLALTLWALQGFTRCVDRLEAAGRHRENRSYSFTVCYTELQRNPRGLPAQKG